MRNKKGLSAIVATLLIILLAIIAFSIVSVVIKNTVGSSAEKIELGQKCLDIEMHSTGITKYVGTTYYNISFTRTLSGTTLDGIKVVLTDSGDNIISEDLVKQIEPLEKWTENMSFSDGQDFIPAKITMIPYFMKESGDVYYCDGVSFTDEINLVNESLSGGFGTPPVAFLPLLTGNVVSPLTGNNIVLLNMDFRDSQAPKDDLNILNVRYSNLDLLNKISPLITTTTKSKEVVGDLTLTATTTTNQEIECSRYVSDYISVVKSNFPESYNVEFLNRVGEILSNCKNIGTGTNTKLANNYGSFDKEGDYVESDYERGAKEEMDNYVIKNNIDLTKSFIVRSSDGEISSYSLNDLYYKSFDPKKDFIPGEIAPFYINPSIKASHADCTTTEYGVFGVTVSVHWRWGMPYGIDTK